MKEQNLSEGEVPLGGIPINSNCDLLNSVKSIQSSRHSIWLDGSLVNPKNGNY